MLQGIRRAKLERLGVLVLRDVVEGEVGDAVAGRHVWANRVFPSGLSTARENRSSALGGLYRAHRRAVSGSSIKLPSLWEGPAGARG